MINDVEDRWAVLTVNGAKTEEPQLAPWSSSLRVVDV